MKLVLATNNQGKVREFARILEPLGIEVMTQKEAGVHLSPEENGKTFAENARIKALAVYRATGLPTVADDSGLCVDALDGEPGVYSARYYGEETPYEEKNRRLIEAVNASGKARTARFVAHITCVLSETEILDCEGDYSNLSSHAIQCMQELGRPYPNSGFGGSFYHWIYSDDPQPYHSFGNGAAMRVSAIGFAARNMREVKSMSHAVTAISHDHPQGLKGAESVAMAIFLARQSKTKQQIRDYIEQNYYKIGFTLDEIRGTYEFNETCQNTVPQAFEAFFEAKDFEDAIRNAVSVGGDSDILAAITGSIAEAYFGVPFDLRKKAENYLENDTFRPIYTWLKRFEKMFP